ncbi:permease prefix domain 1-containing protein [Microbacterium sp. SSW1-49]|uniref:Permease prefix domain 1-containing protein n=1 Tax=Microbacterium croceum TaxID=2851645 RepID=A0ABT0FCP8_9MICO|nr:permease prefix domain 1-containing protein [Microbacterium croceum]MCK2035831.1 permease prefix domain 1-containing protein [Microbacterium croceum]
MTSATLTERYISATIRSLKPDAQADVRAELEASIADAVEARLEQGETRADAERAVLTELGDPGILAAGFADRPLHLIGPRYYLTWWRLLKVLLLAVPVSVLGAVALGQTISGAAVGEIISSAILAAGGVVIQLCFWTTLVFVVLERAGTDTGETWNVDKLPEPMENSGGRSELIAALVFLGIAVGALLWDRFRGFVIVYGEALPILDPRLWPWGISALFVLIVLEAVFAIVVFMKGRWSRGLAVANTVLALAFLAWALALLLRGELINPDFLSHVAAVGGEEFATGDAKAAGEGGTFRILAVLLAFGIAIGVGWDIVDGWIKAVRARRRSAVGGAGRGIGWMP